jgi:hypothetical protein
MEYYLKFLKDKSDGGEPYLYGDMYLPHDGTRKSISADRSPADMLYENNYSVRIVDRTPDKALSIERARQVLPMCWFDEEGCNQGLIRLDGYRKEFDDKLGTWKAQPLHDINSHGADAFMTFADGYHLEREIEEDHESFIGYEGRNGTTGY